MAINATLTSTAYMPQPRANALGSNFVGGKMEISGRTLSDIILLACIPNRYTVVDYFLRGSSAETVAVFKLGIKSAGTATAQGGAGTETTFGTGSFSSTGAVNYRPMTGLPYTVSISDTDAQAGADVYMTVSSGSWTTTVSMGYGFWYYGPGVGQS